MINPAAHQTHLSKIFARVLIQREVMWREGGAAKITNHSVGPALRREKKGIEEREGEKEVGEGKG